MIKDPEGILTMMLGDYWQSEKTAYDVDTSLAEEIRRHLEEKELDETVGWNNMQEFYE